MRTQWLLRMGKLSFARFRVIGPANICNFAAQDPQNLSDSFEIIRFDDQSILFAIDSYRTFYSHGRKNVQFGNILASLPI